MDEPAETARDDAGDDDGDEPEEPAERETQGQKVNDPLTRNVEAPRSSFGEDAE